MTFESFHSSYQALCNLPVRKQDTEKLFSLIRKGQLDKVNPTALLAAGFPPFKK